jgi:hypothetical protein
VYLGAKPDSKEKTKDFKRKQKLIEKDLSGDAS